MDWETYARRLSAEVTDPMSRWRPLVAATPRHVFVPRWWRWASPEGWTACDGEAGQQRWMDAAYSDRTLITRLGTAHVDHGFNRGWLYHGWAGALCLVTDLFRTRATARETTAMPELPRLSLIDETETQPIAAIRPVAESGPAPVARPARPVAESGLAPVARPARPVAPSARPVARPARPVAESGLALVAQPARPARPVAESAQAARPVAPSARPVAQPARPVAQPAPSGRSRRGPGALLAVGGVVLLGIAAAGIFTPIVPHLMARPPAAAHSRASARPSGAASSASSATPTPPASAETLSAAGAALAADVPPAFAGTCRSFTTAPMTGLVTAITCVPSGSGAPAHVEYYQYGSVADLNAAFSQYAGGVSESGTCDQGGRRGTYAFATGPIGGMWACYEDVNRTGQMIWTSTSLDVLAAANDSSQAPQQLSNWFFSAAPTGPQ